MMKITGLSHLFKWENLHNWWLTKYFFAPLYIMSHFLRKFRLCVITLHAERIFPDQGVGSNEHCIGSMSIGTQFMHVALF